MGGYAAAQGFGGQYVFVVPASDLVVTFTSGLAGLRHSLPDELLHAYVLKAVLSDDSLPADAEASTRLEAAVASAAAGPPLVPPDLPDMAHTISGARFEFQPNEHGNQWFTLRFDDDTAFFGFEDDGGPLEAEVGLAGRFVIDDQVPLALRGTWRNDATFVIEFHIIGMVERGRIVLEFEGDEARVIYHDTVLGTYEFSVADRVE